MRCLPGPTTSGSATSTLRPSFSASTACQAPLAPVPALASLASAVCWVLFTCGERFYSSNCYSTPASLLSHKRFPGPHRDSSDGNTAGSRSEARRRRIKAGMTVQNNADGAGSRNQKRHAASVDSCNGGTKTEINGRQDDRQSNKMSGWQQSFDEVTHR